MGWEMYQSISERTLDLLSFENLANRKSKKRTPMTSLKGRIGELSKENRKELFCKELQADARTDKTDCTLLFIIFFG